MSDCCYDCRHSYDGYCELFDDVLGFEDCVLHESSSVKNEKVVR